MSKPSNRFRMSRALPLLLVLGLAALAAYLMLLSRWQDSEPSLTPEALLANSESPAQLELSHRLSAPGDGVAVSLDPSGKRDWLTPLLAFIAPLGAGFLWGAWASRQAAITNGDAASAHAVSWDCEDLERSAGREWPPAEETVPALSREDDTEIADEPHHDEATPASPGEAVAQMHNDPESIDALQARLASKDKVIQTLESIVKENRDEWEEREREAADNLQRIAELEAELGAAQLVIEDGAQPVTGKEYLVDESVSLRPEILPRGQSAARPQPERRQADVSDAARSEPTPAAS